MPAASNVNPQETSGRKEIVSAATGKGVDTAMADYPHAVYREPQGAMKAAEYIFTAWFNDSIYYKSDYEKQLTQWKPEMQRLFTSTFVGAYLEKIAERDKKEGRSSGVPTASLATMQGATVVLKRVDRKTNEYVYSLELSDPEYFDGVEKTEWVVYFEGASVPSTAAAAATAAYAIAGSDVARSYGSSTPQKAARKPQGSYLRKPQ